MQRWKKHIWTGSLLTLSTLLIIAAVAMGAVRLIDLAAPKYREDLSSRLSEALELPVTIGGLGMSWQAFRPSFELDEVIILDDERRPVLQVGHIGLPFKWSSLLSGELFPYLVELNQLALVLEWRADGSIGISGVEAGAEGGELELTEVLGYLDKISRIEIVDGAINWNDFGAQIGLTRIEQVHATLDRTDKGVDVVVDGQFPRHLGESFHIESVLKGDLTKPMEMAISTQFSTDSLFADGWLAPVLSETAALRGGPVKVEFASHWQGLVFQKAALRIEAKPLTNVGQPEAVELPGLNAELNISPLGDGWDMNIVSLQYQYAEGKSPVSRGNFRYQPTPDGFGTRLDAELDSVGFADVMTWVSVLAVAEDAFLPVGSAVKGQLLNTRFEYYQAIGAEAQYELSTQVNRLSMPATEYLPGLKGFDGRFYATHEAGRFELNAENAEVALPRVFSDPLPLENFKAILHMERKDDSWQISSDSLDLDMLSLSAKGRLDLRLDEQASPYIDMQLDFNASDIVPLKPFIPLPPALPADVGKWLQASLQGGEVPSGKFQLRGRLADFPYESKGEKGLFRIDFKAKNTTLQYAPGWPAVEKINGDAVFKGRSMQVKARSGKILDVPISDTLAVIADFKKPLLEVKGKVQADVGKQLAFLAESPLREDYQGLLDALEITGPGLLDLNLALPLNDVQAVSISGDIALQGAVLQYANLSYPVSDIRGDLHFSERGLKAERLDGKFAGLPVTATLKPSPGSSEGVTELHAVAAVSLPQHGPQLQSFLAPEQLAALAGQTDVHLRSEFDTSASASELRVTTDLQGMQIKLGAPFGKEATEKRELAVSVKPLGGITDVLWSFEQLLQGKLRFNTEKDAYLTHAVVQLGAGAEPAWPAKPGIYVQGELPALDVTGLALPVGAASGDLLTLDVNVRLGQLKYSDHIFNSAVIKTHPLEGAVANARQGALHIESTQALGTLQWRSLESGRLNITAAFDRLHLASPKPPEKVATESVDEVAEPIDPAKLPVIALTVKNFRLGNEGLGTLKVDTQAIDTGLRISLLEIGGRRIEVRAGGEWTREAGKSTARLVMNINGNDIVGLLNATGYAQSITAEQADIFVELDWAPDAAGLEMARLNGKMSFDLVDGSLLEVKPGAGRVLSLLSFYSLPRRLSLDFSDVLGKGTAFDRLTGDFAIVDGNAMTDDLQVIMPSARIEVRGRVGLAAQDYDQIVTIYPGISSGVALAGAVLGGPILGIGLWIAQEFLDKPFDQVAQLSYHMTGSWDDPQVKGLGAEARPEIGLPPPTSKEIDAPITQSPAAGESDATP